MKKSGDHQSLLKMNYRICHLLLPLVTILSSAPMLSAQDSPGNRSLNMEEVFQLALNNSVQLKVQQQYTELARQQTEINKLARLPGISTDLGYGYISNIDVWDPSFSEHQKGGVPHPLTQLSVSVAEVIFKGNEINHTIRKSTLEEQIAFLKLEKNTTDIKFLVAAVYLDIYRLLNQRKVYINNTRLAEHRLANILTLRKQGMVTSNDVLRTELTISGFQLNTRKITNSIAELNNQLNMVLGLPDSSRLIPDSNLLRRVIRNGGLDEWMEEAYKENHELKIAAVESEISETNVNLLKGERYPELRLFAGSALQRPFLNNIPALDIYYNIYEAGISLHYNISSIYQSPRKIKAGRIALEQTRQNGLLQKQMVELAVKNSYIKYNESRDELATYRSDLKSAEENYRIVEKKYFNQLSLLADLIDATDTKIEAELKVTNAEINCMYNHFQLLKSTGKL